MKKRKAKPKPTLAQCVSAVKHLTRALNKVADGQHALRVEVHTALAELDAQRGFIDSLSAVPAKTPTLQPTG